MNGSTMVKKTYTAAEGNIVYWINDSHASKNAVTLVFLPGLTADHRLFEKQVEHFSKSCACLVWDPPAHGESRPFTEFSLESWARALFFILEAEGIEKPVLVGQSMGGYVSQMYIELFPDKLAGFVSVDSCPLQRHYYTVAEVWLLKHTRLMYKAIPWNTLVRWGTTGVADSSYGQALMEKMMLSYEPADYVDLTASGYGALAEAIESGRSFELTCPTLLIYGENDRAGSAKRYNKAWSKQTGLPMHWIADAGHNSNCDKPDEVNRLIEEFVVVLG